MAVCLLLCILVELDKQGYLQKLLENGAELSAYFWCKNNLKSLQVSSLRKEGILKMFNMGATLWLSG